MISHRNLFLTVMLAVSQTMCIWGKRLPVVAPEKVGLSSTLLQRADSAILQAIAEKEIPGAVLCVVRHDRIGYLKAYVNKQVWPEKLPMETGTVFDMASCSKSSSTSNVASCPCMRASTRWLLISNPTVGNFVEKRRAKGRPT